MSYLLLFLFLFFSFAETQTVSPTPPTQPKSGTGGMDYRHTQVTKNVYGEGAEQYWLFEPAKPTPKSAPLIVFNHGWGGTNPKVYGAWIEHIVRRGNIVVYPRYQAEWRYPPDKITENAIKAVKNAIKELQKKGHIKPELDKFAIAGHSAGGQITANMAALASSKGLPEPKAIMSVQPGKSWNVAKKVSIPLEELKSIPEGTLLLTVVGDKDNIARDIDAKKIFNGTPQIPKSNKDFIIVVSDDYGKPELAASHFSPCALDNDYDSGEKIERKKGGGFLRTRIRERLGKRLAERRKSEDSDENDIPSVERGENIINALDYYGYWKLFDGLCDAAFYGKNRKYALGNTPQQRFMGKWSDGTPVKELIVTDNP